MQQRQLRLGDIVDDYCPRERRVTNHAIVAMIEQQVKQTRCVTCDAEHEYKAARVPPQRKKKESPAALYKQVLADAMKPEAGGAILSRHNGNHQDETPLPVVPVDPAPGMPPDAPTEAAAPDDRDTPPEAEPEAPNEEREEREEEDGPVHRPLIRATLPRHEGQTPARKEPDFTVRMTRGGRFRPHAGPGHNRPQGGGHGQTRHAGSRPPQHGARGNRPAQGQGRPGQRHGHGKKRSK